MCWTVSDIAIGCPTVYTALEEVEGGESYKVILQIQIGLFFSFIFMSLVWGAYEET